MLIELSEDEILACYEFASQVAPTNSKEYARRGQRDLDKIIRQIYEGKIAEVAVHHFLDTTMEGEVSPVDFDIYSYKDKSFASDLTHTLYDTTHYHVKSQSAAMAKRFGASWLFQQNDPLVLEPKPEDFIVLCTTHERAVEIRAVVSAQQIQQFYALPKVPQLRRTKVALYLKHLKTANMI